MTGYLLLEGGAEFGGRMADPDRRAIELAVGWDAPLCVIPAAAAPDHNHARAGENARRWFTSLGARRVSVLPLIDRASADSPEIADALRAARLIYMLGGFPGHLCESLRDSLSWEAMLEAYQAGAVLGGSSAGAMVLAEHLYDPYRGQALPGLGLLPGICILPHHASFGKRWAPALQAQFPQAALLGIDERTGLLDDGPAGEWSAYGQGAATLYRQGQVSAHPAGQLFRL